MADQSFLDDLDGLADAAALRGSGWRQLIESLPQIVWITRPDGWHIHFNRQWMAFTGLSLAESLEFGWNPSFHPDDRGRAAGVWEHATATGEPYEIEYRLRRHDGKYRWMLGRAMPLHDVPGDILAWFGTCTDIDDLKRAHAELESSRALQRVAGSVARLGSWSLDVAVNQVVWSEEIFEILDYPRDTEVVVEEALELFPVEDRDRLVAALGACAGSGTPFDLELRVETHLGARQWARVIGEASYRPDGTVSHVAGAHQDITAQKEADSQVRLLAERLATTLESITDAFFTVDLDWRMTYVNHHAEELLGRSRDGLIGHELWQAFPEAVGSVFDEVYRRAMHTGVSEVVEDFYWEPLGVWLAVDVYPSAQGLAVYLRDISDRHHAEQALRQLNEELNLANARLEEASQIKDDLLSMASHELRTPLTPILGFVELLEARGNLTTDQQEILGVVGSNAKRMLRLVDDLLAVGRMSAGALVGEPQDVSVEAALLEVLDELGETVGRVDLDVAGYQVVVDPQHLEQILSNLLTNASKYGAPPVSVTAKPAGVGRIALEVADRGAGIAPDFQAHMWDRFVQKDRGDRRTATGVGLGLSIAKWLAEANDGTVSYRDCSPTGAVFTVELPGKCHAEPAPTADGLDARWSTNETGRRVAVPASKQHIPPGRSLQDEPVEVLHVTPPRSDDARTENDLLEQLAEIAHRLSEADGVDELLQLIVDLGEDYLEGCDGASLMLIGKGRTISSPAYSSRVAYESDLAQYQADEGPCLDALRDHAVYLIDDLETEQRWPQYRAAALKLGVRSMLSYRLYARGETYGALDFYAKRPNVYSPYSKVIGQVFASHAGVALKGAITEAGMEKMIESGDIIGQARGMLMERDHLSAADAFDTLTAMSRNTNTPMRDIAEQITSGEIPA